MAIVVNGERIEERVVHEEAMRLQRSGTPEDEAKKQARENIISQVIVRQRAREANIPITENDIEVELMRLYAESGGKAMFLNRHRLTEEDEPRVKAHVTEELRIRRLIDHVCEDVPQPAPADVEDYFRQHTDEFVEPAQIRASHIVKRPTGPNDEETYQTMVDLRQKLLAGEDFAATANECSDCSNEPDGDLGFFEKGKMVEAFETVAFSLNVGEISPVILTQFGYHILSVTDKKPPRQKALDEVREEIARALHEEKKDECFNQFLEKARATADVKEVAESPSPSTPKKKSGKKRGKKK